jgi:hypothetical protein
MIQWLGISRAKFDNNFSFSPVQHTEFPYVDIMQLVYTTWKNRFVSRYFHPLSQSREGSGFHTACVDVGEVINGVHRCFHISSSFETAFNRENVAHIFLSDFGKTPHRRVLSKNNICLRQPVQFMPRNAPFPFVGSLVPPSNGRKDRNDPGSRIAAPQARESPLN